MRRSVLVAAFAATTALTPAPAQAGPIPAFIGGALNALGFGTWLGSSAFVGAWSAGFTAATWLTTSFVGRIVLSVGLSALSSALMPGPKLPKPSEVYANYAQPVTYAPWVFGRCRVGGSLGFTAASRTADPITGTDGKKRHYSPIIAAHPCEGVVEHWLDERLVEIDANGLVTTAPYVFTTDRSIGINENGIVVTQPSVNSNVRIRPFLGQVGQVADPAMVTIFPEITAAHDFAGLSGAHIWARNPGASTFTEVYPTSREPAWTPVIDGHSEIYDPRTNSTGYSDNSALIIAAWLTKVWGKQVDWAEVAAEADACDVTVTDRNGASRKKWVTGWSFTDDAEFETQRAQLCAACDAFIYERRDGKIGFKVGRYSAPTVTLTDDDILSMEVSEGGFGRNLPTEVAATYIEPAAAWREATTGAYIITTGERLVTEEPQLYAVTNHNQAARICKRIGTVKRYRRQYKISLGLSGFNLFEQRFVRVTADGWDDVIEVGEFGIDEGGGTFYLVGTSVSAADFDFDASTEEPTPPAFGAVSSSDALSVPTGLSGAALSGAAIRWTWDAQDADLVQQLRAKRTTDSDWHEFTAPSGQLLLDTTGLIDGEQYEAQIRNRTSGGKTGDWSASVIVRAVYNTTAPDTLTAFDATPSGFDVNVTFTAPNDANYFATRIYRGTTTTFSAAALVRTEYGIPSAGDSWADTALASGTYYYWGVPINDSGIPADDGTIPGTASGPITVTV